MQVLRQWQLFQHYSRYGNCVALDPNCLFCKIINGDIPAQIVFRNENVVAFKDIDPQAPTHVLIVPTLHVENAAELAKMSPTLTADLFVAAGEIAATKWLNWLQNRL